MRAAQQSGHQLVYKDMYILYYIYICSFSLLIAPAWDKVRFKQVDPTPQHQTKVLLSTCIRAKRDGHPPSLGTSGVLIGSW